VCCSVAVFQKILMDECREALLKGTTVTNRTSSSHKGAAVALHWLTAGQLAASVINLAAPILLTGRRMFQQHITSTPYLTLCVAFT
jgi:hypothetical protein